MRVLLYGGGAREHALAWKIKQSHMLTKLFLFNCNDGFKELGEVINARNIDELVANSVNNNIDLVVIGPEAPLVSGVVDEFNKAGIKCIGATKKWAELEGSKSFAKEFMVKHNIPTAKYSLITDISQACTELADFKAPYVIKADGLASGKGVYIANSQEEAWTILSEYLSGMFGEASKKIVLEEFINGEELSLIAFWDGNTLLPLIPARDYKKLFEGDKGPNTGGMGAYCPVDLNLNQKSALDNYIKLLEKALKAEKADFCGIIYSGLMLSDDELKVLEFNMRFGDPETQTLMMHMDFDLLELFSLCANKELDKANLKWKDNISFCVVVAANGYPQNPKMGTSIENINMIKNKFDVEVFYAGIKEKDGKIYSDGGRVLTVCSNIKNARNVVYDAVKELEYVDKYYRSDIGE